MWWDICCHSNSNPHYPIHKKIWKSRWKNCWFLFCSIKIIFKIYCFFFNISQHKLSKFSHFSFSISICCCIISIHRSKVSLTINKWISKRKVLSHSYHSFINWTITMRMIISKYMTNYSCWFSIFCTCFKTLNMHRIKNSPMNWF